MSMLKILNRFGAALKFARDAQRPHLLDGLPSVFRIDVTPPVTPHTRWPLSNGWGGF